MINLDAGTLVEALQKSAQGDRGITYINGKTDEQEISYRELWDRASRLLGYLHSNGVAGGEELVLLVESNQEFVDVFWASLLGGIVAVPLAIGASDVHFHKLFNVFRKLQQPRLYSTEKNLRRLEKFSIHQGFEAEFNRIRATTVLPISAADRRIPAEPATVFPQQTAFIQFSSGSTGDPKGVVLSHHNVMSNVRAILSGIRARETDSSLSWMPMTHDMGIIGFHLAPLVANVPLYLMPTELFVRRPMLWVQKVSEKRATITASPNFGLKHLLKRFNADSVEIDLSCVRLIINGAEPISASLCREFSQTMQSVGYDSRAMFPVYGLAEASLAVTFSDPGSGIVSLFVRRNSLATNHRVMIVSEANRDSLELVSVGVSVDGCEVMIANKHGEAVGNEQVGHILIRGDNVTSGYYRDSELNSQVFKADGWLDTGDLGFIQDGQLFIAGREKDLIIINGRNFHPHDLEMICESIDGIELGKVAAFGLQTDADSSENLVIFVIFRGAVEDFVGTAREIRRLLNEQVGIDVEFVIPVRAIPKTTSGKIQRYRLAEQFLNGEFDSVITALEELMTRSGAKPVVTGRSIQETLLNICHSVIDDRSIDVDDDLFELGTSSLKLAQIHERIEEQFPGRVEVSDLFEYPSVAELAAFLENGQVDAK